MLANHMIKRRDGFKDANDIRVITLKFENAKHEIERCAKDGVKLSVPTSYVLEPLVVDALRLIGFTLGESFEVHEGHIIGYIQRNRTYLIPT